MKDYLVAVRVPVARPEHVLVGPPEEEARVDRGGGVGLLGLLLEVVGVSALQHPILKLITGCSCSEDKMK